MKLTVFTTIDVSKKCCHTNYLKVAGDILNANVSWQLDTVSQAAFKFCEKYRHVLISALLHHDVSTIAQNKQTKPNSGSIWGPLRSPSLLPIVLQTN